MDGQDFNLQLDTTAQRITGIISILFLAILAFIWEAALTSSSNISVTIIASAFIIIIYGVIYILHPTSYQLNSTHLKIKRPIGYRQYNLADCEGFCELQAKDIKGSTRSSGVGGLWGYFGGFLHKVLGDMTWYISSRKRTIFMKFSTGDNLLISPVDIDDFKRQLSRLELPIITIL